MSPLITSLARPWRRPIAASASTVWRGREPGGYTQLTNEGFATRATPSGWFGYQNTNDNFCEEFTDASAPVSPSKGISAVYNIGFLDSDTPVVLEYVFPAEQRELYLAFAIRLPGPTWEWHSSGVNKMFFIDTNAHPSPDITNEGVLSLISDNPSDVRFECHWQYPTIQEMTHNVTPKSFVLSTWTIIEAQFIRSTGGAANGIARVWQDGAQTIERTDVAYNNSVSATFRSARFHPNWGGSASQAKTQRDLVQIDHIYMSGVAA